MPNPIVRNLCYALPFPNLARFADFDEFVDVWKLQEDPEQSGRKVSGRQGPAALLQPGICRLILGSSSYGETFHRAVTVSILLLEKQKKVQNCQDSSFPSKIRPRESQL